MSSVVLMAHIRQDFPVKRYVMITLSFTTGGAIRTALMDLSAMDTVASQHALWGKFPSMVSATGTPALVAPMASSYLEPLVFLASLLAQHVLAEQMSVQAVYLES